MSDRRRCTTAAELEMLRAESAVFTASLRRFLELNRIMIASKMTWGQLRRYLAWRSPWVAQRDLWADYGLLVWPGRESR